jgi:murein DD-endopeptidase MepM/ murein hydrolase activator NlpD
MRTATFGFVLLLSACGGGGGGGGGGGMNPNPPAAQCGPYPNQATSSYILPYEVGTSHAMFHGNCTAPGTSHQAGGTREHAYDFQMPIGTILIAARGGTVSLVEQQFPDGTRNPAHNNYVIITHADGTHGRYFHIAQNGSLVAVGQDVAQGDPIALSGDSGESTEPHLHFVVEPAGNPPGEPHGGTPVTFLNTAPHPNGLVEGVVYEALPYPGCNCGGP